MLVHAVIFFVLLIESLCGQLPDVTRLHRIWDVVATTRFSQPLRETALAVFVAYLSESNPWSLSMRELLSCLPHFFRREDCVFLKVTFEEMTYTEQMHHRLGALPAFKIYTTVRCLKHSYIPWSK